MFSSFTSVTIPIQWEKEYRSERSAENNLRIKLITYICLTFGVVISIQHQFVNSATMNRTSEAFFQYRYIYIAMLVASLSSLIALRAVKNKGVFLRNLCHVLIIVTYLAICMLLNLVDLIRSNDLMAFVIPLMVLDSLAKSTFILMLFFHFYAYLVLAIGLTFFSPSLDPFYHFFIGIYILIGMMIWWSQDRVWKKSFLTKMALESEIQEKEKAQEELKSAQLELIENAHKAGMAEIASDTLHNIGNVLNSVTTSAHLIKVSAEKSPYEDFSKLCELLQDHSSDINKHIKNNQEGAKLIDFMSILQQRFYESYKTISGNTDRLFEKTDLISQIVLAQQNYAGNFFLTETFYLPDIVEDAFSLLPDIFAQNGIKLKKTFDAVPKIKAQKTRLLHVLVNLIKNAVQATINEPVDEKWVQIRIRSLNNNVVLEVSDNGHGIEQEKIKKIFSHGYTTKKDGFGFGLHSCAIYLQEMGGSISAESEGLGMGATFKVEFPAASTS